VKKPSWINERDALILHDRLLAFHGGAAGVRDDGLLAPALARPRQHFAYAETADIIHLAAIHTDGIVRNHPFVDGNKRTGFVIGILFLETNGHRFTAREEAAAKAMLALAAGEIEADEYAEFLRANVTREDAEN
jgi:death-on-curing protein